MAIPTPPDAFAALPYKPTDNRDLEGYGNNRRESDLGGSGVVPDRVGLTCLLDDWTVVLSCRLLGSVCQWFLPGELTQAADCPN